MPKLVHPLPEPEYGPRQPPKLDPKDAIKMVSAAVKKIDDHTIYKSKEGLDTLLLAVGF